MEIDPETFEGDYREAFQHIKNWWDYQSKDNFVSSDYFDRVVTPAWDRYKDALKERLGIDKHGMD